jgi:hypothetical protein
MRGQRFLGVWCGLALAGAVIAQACGGSKSSGNDVTCGPGTMLDGSICYVSSGSSEMDGSSDDGGAVTSEGGGKGDAQAAFTFGGAVAAAPASSTALLVVWNPATAMVDGGGVFSYRVYIGTTPGGENFSAPTLEAGAGTTSVVVTSGLTANTKYYVVVRAVDAAGHEDTNTVEQSATLQSDTTAPVFGGVTSVMSAPEASLTVSWTAATDNLTPAAGIVYDVFVSTTAGGENLNLPTAVSPPGGTSLTIGGLLAGTMYYVVVRAVDAAGNTDLSFEDIIEKSGMSGSDTLAPTFGGCTSATQVDPQSIAVTWQPASDNSTPPLKIAYDVFASTTDGTWDFSTPTKTLTATGPTALTGGVVDGLKSGTQYFLVCRARDLSGNEDTNTFVRVASTEIDITPPTFAGVSTVTNVDTSSAVLTWNTPATDPETQSADIVYLVYQSNAPGTEVPAADAGADAGAAFVPAAVTAPGATSITLTGLNSNTTYYWVVRAENRGGITDGNRVELTATTLISFTNDVAAPILGVNCAITGCHENPNPPNGLNMSLGQAYSHLVNVPVVEFSSMVRVNPGNHMQSYIYLKLTGEGVDGGPGGPNGICTNAPCPPNGARMPLTGIPIPQSEINTIANWIDQGALNN